MIYQLGKVKSLRFSSNIIVSVVNRTFSINHSALNSSDLRTNESFKLGFVGAGKIAQAIIQGLIKKQKLQPEQIYVSDANAEYVRFLKEKHPILKDYKLNYLNNNSEVFNQVNTVMVCVKPKDITKVLKEVSSRVNRNHLVLSIAAGIQIRQIEKCLPNDSRVIRIMTNVTALIQQSCSVYSRGTNATLDDGTVVKNLLESIGNCEDEINEDAMDAVTGLSGSGPAYMFVVLDALADGGVKMGLSRQLSLRLAAQTMLGSASMVVKELDSLNGKHILQMKEEVCSPGGTTIFGISELESHRMRAAFIKCVEAATNRARELSEKN